MPSPRSGRRPKQTPPLHPQQLALFDPAAAAASADSADTASRPHPDDTANAAPFRHPRGERQVLLGGHAVTYALKRVRRKSIGFIVGPDGLAVNVPSWVGSAAIDTALQAKSGWILRKLVEQRDRARRLQSARIDWRDGTEIDFLGRRVVVVLDPSVGASGQGAVLDAAAALDACTPPAERAAPTRLRIALPHGAGPAQIRDLVQSWLQRQARRIFEERCRHFAAQLGVRWTRLALSSAQTRWGSASADGSIRLHWRLVHFALPTIDYVVAHELAHLREMNHSARFWDVVRSVLPDYEQARGSLKSDLLARFD
jgi:predicted metal-dependent hydrolase